MKGVTMINDFIQLFENAGVPLPNENSLGNKIIPDDDKEKIINFWNWFGDSKIVDKQGRPLVVYHGTLSRFNSFDPSKSKNGFFFAPLNRKGFVSGYYAFGGNTSNGQIMACYLKMETPLVDHRPNGLELRKAENDGTLSNYDGVIAVWDKTEPLSSLQYDYIEDKLAYDSLNQGDPIEFTVFNPSQIKSVENDGSFSTASTNIYESFT